MTHHPSDFDASLDPATVVVAFEAGDLALRERAQRLSADLDLALVGSCDHQAPGTLLLVVTSTGLDLRDGLSPRERGAQPDFLRLDRRVATGNLSRKQPLARAIGRDGMHVFDATAGLGHDALLLAMMGYHVTAVERSPVLAALLTDAIERAREDPEFDAALGDRLTICGGDACRLLPEQTPAPDTVYIDPMYPVRAKASALPKKPIRLVRRLVGADTDAARLLDVARRHAHRVVVKRPHHADPIAADPSFTVGSKLVRYDVYIQNGRTD